MCQGCIGTNGSDQRRFFQRDRVKHRSTGRGAQHDDIRIFDRTGQFGMDAHARIDVPECLLLGRWQSINIGCIQPDIPPFAQCRDMPGMSLPQPPYSHHGQLADIRGREQIDGECSGSRRSLNRQLSRITEQTGLTVIHRHHQRPGRHQSPFRKRDIGRELCTKDPLLGKRSEVADKVALPIGKRIAQLWRLHCLFLSQRQEHTTQCGQHINLIDQFGHLN
ncbi:hypothetical protein D3C76_401850 [compost metagenome]